MGDNSSLNNINFEFSDEILDEIQKNIQDIIEGFDIPDANKVDVIKKINFMYAQTKQMSLTDALTGLYNRRHFEYSLEREFLRARRYHSDLSLAIIDVDFFKKINDTYGHSCGDYVLKEIAFLMNETFRKTDIVSRYGGEEFAVILTETELEKSFIPLERFRQKVAGSDLRYKNQEFKITVSIGVVSLVQDISTPWEMFDLADKALYFAKENGRNRVVGQ